MNECAQKGIRHQMFTKKIFRRISVKMETVQKIGLGNTARLMDLHFEKRGIVTTNTSMIVRSYKDGPEIKTKSLPEGIGKQCVYVSKTDTLAAIAKTQAMALGIRGVNAGHRTNLEVYALTKVGEREVTENAGFQGSKSTHVNHSDVHKWDNSLELRPSFDPDLFIEGGTDEVWLEDEFEREIELIEENLADKSSHV